MTHDIPHLAAAIDEAFKGVPKMIDRQIDDHIQADPPVGEERTRTLTVQIVTTISVDFTFPGNMEFADRAELLEYARDNIKIREIHVGLNNARGAIMDADSFDVQDVEI